MADQKKMTRAEFEAELVKRAWADPEFKKKLLSTPREAIEQEFRKIRPDAKLPATAQYYVHEETPNSLHITLPMNPAEFKGSKEEWDNYAQGGCIVIAVVEIVAGSIAMVGVAVEVEALVVAHNALITSTDVATTTTTTTTTVTTSTNG